MNRFPPPVRRGGYPQTGGPRPPYPPQAYVQRKENHMPILTFRQQGYMPYDYGQGYNVPPNYPPPQQQPPQIPPYPANYPVYPPQPQQPPNYPPPQQQPPSRHLGRGLSYGPPVMPANMGRGGGKQGGKQAAQLLAQMGNIQSALQQMIVQEQQQAEQGTEGPSPLEIEELTNQLAAIEALSKKTKNPEAKKMAEWVKGALEQAKQASVDGSVPAYPSGNQTVSIPDLPNGVDLKAQLEKAFSEQLKVGQGMLVVNAFNTMLGSYLSDMVKTFPEEKQFRIALDLVKLAEESTNPKLRRKPIEEYSKSMKDYLPLFVQPMKDDKVAEFLKHAHEIEFIKDMRIQELWQTLDDDSRGETWNIFCALRDLVVLYFGFNAETLGILEKIASDFLVDNADRLKTKQLQLNDIVGNIFSRVKKNDQLKAMVAKMSQDAAEDEY